MVFGAIMPAFVGFANWMIPMMIGASDMAFARMNNWSFWLLPPAAILLTASIFVPGGAAGTGWTLYPPLSVQMGMGMDMAIFAVHILGMSSIMGSINIITTILNMRTPGMTLMKMPLFCWTWLVTAFLLIASMPILAGAVTMLLTDRHFGTSFFNAAGGGDPVLFQHIFWFFGHPEVYIIALPAFGVVSHVIPAFSRKPPVWLCLDGLCHCRDRPDFVLRLGAPHVRDGHPAHRPALLHVCDDADRGADRGEGLQLGHHHVARLADFETPMLFALGFLVLFTIGGLTGLVLAMTAVDIQLQDTYYVVAHFHYVMVAGALFSAYAGLYYWLPKWTGHMYNETSRQAALLAVDGLLQHRLLPAALPRPGRHAATDSRLCAAVRRFQHDFQHWLLRLRLQPVAGPGGRLQGDEGRRQGGAGPGMARTDWNGPCPRRRRTIPSKIRLRFDPAEAHG
jgi:cytochrome c oxidase subunit 1